MWDNDPCAHVLSHSLLLYITLLKSQLIKGLDLKKTSEEHKRQHQMRPKSKEG